MTSDVRLLNTVGFVKYRVTFVLGGRKRTQSSSRCRRCRLMITRGPTDRGTPVSGVNTSVTSNRLILTLGDDCRHTPVSPPPLPIHRPTTVHVQTHGKNMGCSSLPTSPVSSQIRRDTSQSCSSPVIVPTRTDRDTGGFDVDVTTSHHNPLRPFLT